jgi:hypothetical protein
MIRIRTLVALTACFSVLILLSGHCLSKVNAAGPGEPLAPIEVGKTYEFRFDFLWGDAAYSLLGNVKEIMPGGWVKIRTGSEQTALEHCINMTHVVSFWEMKL